jgi:ubiquinone/menaquinone biosynthesis C-methylase UbiE
LPKEVQKHETSLCLSDFFGFDLSRQAIGLTRLNSPDTRAVVASAVHIPYRDNTFRYITCTGVLEHVPDIKAALQEIMRVSVENASFCIMVPNSRTLYWKIFEKISRAHCQSNENALSLQEWEDVFHGQGLSPEKIFRDEWLSRKLLNILGLKAFPDLIHSIQKILWKLIPLKYSHQFVFIFKVKSDDYKQ